MSERFTGRWEEKTNPFLHDEIFVSPELGSKKEKGWQNVAKIGGNGEKEGHFVAFMQKMAWQYFTL